MDAGHQDRGHQARVALVAAALLLAAGCTTVTQQPLRPGVDDDEQCVRWFEALDRTIDEAGVRDAENHRITGFPGLRVNRLEAARTPSAQAPAAEYGRWVERLRALDEHDRRIEIGNLPPTRDDWLARLPRCSAQLADASREQPAARALLVERAQVPERYSTAARAAGLYALTRWPFFAGVRNWEREHLADMRVAAAGASTTQRFAPAETTSSDPELAAWAPEFEIDAQGPFDRFGTPGWNEAGALDVRSDRPVVFHRRAQTLVQGRLLQQLVYTLWFPERPARGAFDLLAGRLDGVIVRLTLAPDGTPWMLDTIHACGCYHLFFPAAGVQLRPGAPDDEEWAFVAAPLPAFAPGTRPLVRLSSGAHQVLAVGATASITTTARYALREEADLRRLPLPGGGTRSLYGPDGLVAGSERAERWLFWPMGIASAGAMRQWGHHATAFVGRRHFDDADLFDRRFVFPGRLSGFGLGPR